MIRSRNHRLWLAIPLAGALAFTLTASADVLVGPTLDINLQGWPDSGMQFEALVDVELVEITFNNQGLSDTIHFWNRTTNSLLATIAVDAGNAGAFVVPIGINLTAGHEYSLQNDGPSNGRFTPYTSYPTFNDHLSALGVRDGAGTLFTDWWFTFTHLTTSGGGFDLSIDMPNGCPGSITVSWTGSPGNGLQVLVIGNSLGSTTIPTGFPCAGTVLGIQGSVATVVPPGFFSNGGGSGSLNGNVNNANVCGKYLQLVRGGSCETSDVEEIN